MERSHEAVEARGSVAGESELRWRVARRVVADWQAEHGVFAAAELAAARAEMDGADAEAWAKRG
ncbi:hypothetical protein HH310_35240 [Actinoplanes sp. TBRC 11911]|uniref:hypothetical protein n=1 Tax=Actinoplanes sp. TBRC 11911 TaxID=2729386 RepID=UPI00145D5DE9|nr:hypothetical protein [Actinoplanes sp. TBRC 11911]NMO56420.1 hypothetical protein [Actinoplanes sp. TBRC 11911]